MNNETSHCSTITPPGHVSHPAGYDGLMSISRCTVCLYHVCISLFVSCVCIMCLYHCLYGVVFVF